MSAVVHIAQISIISHQYSTFRHAQLEVKARLYFCRAESGSHPSQYFFLAVIRTEDTLVVAGIPWFREEAVHPKRLPRRLLVCRAPKGIFGGRLVKNGFREWPQSVLMRVLVLAAKVQLSKRCQMCKCPSLIMGCGKAK